MKDLNSQKVTVFADIFSLNEAASALYTYETELISRYPAYGREYYAAYQAALDHLCFIYIVEFFKIHLPADVNIPLQSDQFMRTLGIKHKFTKFFNFFLKILQEENIISVSDGTVSITSKFFESFNSAKTEIELISTFSMTKKLIHFLKHCVSNYTHVLIGEGNGLDVLFPEGNSSLVSEVFAEILKNSNFILYAELLSKIIISYMEKNPTRKIKILEIGAGKGTLTALLMKFIDNKNFEYHFTDLGSYFVRSAKNNSSEIGLNIAATQFYVFDITKDVLTQGLTKNSFDIIIGYDVVHGTPNIKQTLNNLKPLLSQGGLLCLLEITASYRWIEMIWGLVDGWWDFEDTDVRHYSPLMPLSSWEYIFNQLQFSSVQIFPQATHLKATTDYGLMIAQS